MNNDDDVRPLELNLAGRHLAAAAVGLVALCLSFFFLGRWVERSSWEAEIRPAPFEEFAGPEGADTGPAEPVVLDEDLTFYEDLEPDRNAPAATTGDPDTVAGGFTIQVNAYQNAAAAEQQAAKLKGKGYPAYVEAGTDGRERALYRVRVGPFERRGQADEVAARLQKEEGLSTWVRTQ